MTNAQVGVGTKTPNSKSMLEVVSTNKGVLIPRLTYTQITQISPTSNEVGLFVYNTDEKCINFWNGTSWQSLCGGGTVCDPAGMAEFEIACSQFPAADTNSYAIGSNISGSITLNVKVLKAGPYYISVSSTTNDVNYTSAPNASFTAAEVGTTKTITLNGGGTPSTTPVTLNVKGNGGVICTYTKTAASNAAFTYSCSTLKIEPSYYSNDVKYFRQGEALTSSDVITVSVNVSTPGNYNISTSFNGMTFSKSGAFTTTGVQTLTLTGSGTPTNDGVFKNQNLTLTNTTGNTICTANYYVLTSKNYGSNSYNGDEILMNYAVLGSTTWNNRYGLNGYVSDVATYKNYLAHNDLLTLDIKKGSQTLACWYKIYFKNISGSAADVHFKSWNNDNAYFDYNTILDATVNLANNGRVGSIDTYSNTSPPTDILDVGAFAGYPYPGFTPERVYSNVSIKVNDIWYNYIAIFDARSTNGSYSFFRSKLQYYSSSIVDTGYQNESGTGRPSYSFP